MDSSHNGSGARSGAPLIRAERVSYSIDETLILREVSLVLHPGEMVGLIGPNGAGKSTLLKVLIGLWRGAEGDIRLIERPLASYTPREVARYVAYVPQTTAVDFAFTVREMVLMGRSPHLGRFEFEGEEDRRIADEAMHKTGVLHLADRFVNTLSGGERQRVFIARALAQQPRILLLDEPTANLDIRHQLDILDMVAGLAGEQGLGVIAAIHDLNLAAHFCGRLILLHEGRVLADDTPDAVLTPQNLSLSFGVEARVYRDPFTQGLRLSISRDGNGHHRAREEATSEGRSGRKPV